MQIYREDKFDKSRSLWSLFEILALLCPTYYSDAKWVTDSLRRGDRLETPNAYYYGVGSWLSSRERGKEEQ